MTEHTISNLDRIMFKGVKEGPDGRPEVAIIHLPQWENKFTYHPGGLLNIPGIDVIDTTNINPLTNENPSFYIAGDLVGEHQIPLVEGEGAVLLDETFKIPASIDKHGIIDLQEGVELAVDARRLTNKLSKKAQRRGLDLSSAKSPMADSLTRFRT